MYFKLGQLATMAVAHGGAGFHVLCPSVYNYISWMGVANVVVNVDEVPNAEVRDFIHKVSCGISIFE